MTSTMLRQLSDVLDRENATLNCIYNESEYGAPAVDAADADRFTAELHGAKGQTIYYIRYRNQNAWKRAVAVPR